MISFSNWSKQEIKRKQFVQIGGSSLKELDERYSQLFAKMQISIVELVWNIMKPNINHRILTTKTERLEMSVNVMWALTN